MTFNPLKDEAKVQKAFAAAVCYFYTKYNCVKNRVNRLPA